MAQPDDGLEEWTVGRIVALKEGLAYMDVLPNKGFLRERFEASDRPDAINHPDHYKWLPVEAIEITEHFNFCMGNALKYIIRADHKGKPVEDMKKAIFYLQREIANREAGE